MRLTFLLVLLFVSSHPMRAQPNDSRRVSFSWSAGPLNAVLPALGDSLDLNLSLPTRLLRDRTVPAGRVVDAPLPALLDRLLRDSPAAYQLNPSGLVIYRRPVQRRTLSGYVRDADTNERLIGANVYAPTEAAGCSTNAFGFYSHPFRTTTRELQVSYLGYQTATIPVDGTRSLDVALRPSLTLTELVVTAAPDTSGTEGPGASTAPLLQKALPALGQAPDPLRLLGLDPGVRTAADGFGGLHVRGGNTDQNLVLLDDVPVYQPSHTFGLFSIFNPALLRDQQFYKAGFPARYDGRTSSVLDVRTREGNTRRAAGALHLGNFTSSALLELPLLRERAGLLVAGRRSFVDYWLRPYSRERLATANQNGETDYRLHDLNAKLHYTPGRRHRLYLNYYRGGDRYTQRTIVREAANSGAFASNSDRQETLDWGNEISSLRWNWQVADRLFVNTTATYSDFEYGSTEAVSVAVRFFGTDTLNIRQQTRYQSRIQDYSLRTDADFYWSARHRLRAGLHTNRRQFTPGLSRSQTVSNGTPTPAAGTGAATPELNTTEWTAYVEEHYHHRRWRARVGLRLAAFFHSNRRSLPFQPRLRLSYRAGTRWHLYASATQTAQFIQLLTTIDAGLPDDLWVPTPVGFSPQVARQYTLGSHGKLGKQFQWRLDAYHKRFRGLLRLRPELLAAGESTAIRVDARNFGRSVETGSGRAYGLEAQLEKQRGALTGRLSYGYLRAERRFRGQAVVFPFDSRHSAAAQLTYAPAPRWTFGALTHYQSGRSFSAAAAPFPLAPLLEPVAVSPGERLPAYHRLDLSGGYQWGTRFSHRLQLSLYNVYNRQNTLTVSAAPGEGGFSATAGLPRLLFVGYWFEW